MLVEEHLWCARGVVRYLLEVAAALVGKEVDGMDVLCCGEMGDGFFRDEVRFEDESKELRFW